MEQITRTEARKIIMISLYQIFLESETNLENINKILDDNLEIDNEFVRKIVIGVINNQEEIDNLANKHLKDWKLTRLALTDQAIIKMAIYELLYEETPAIVAINEAVELASIYSDDKVKSMINATLDTIYHERNNDGN